MSTPGRAAVIGLGLIGGSVARDLAARGVHVTAFDADAAQLDAAVNAGVVAERLDASLGGVRDAEIVVIAVPVDAALAVLQRVCVAVRAPGARTRLITDVGSTKATIVSLASSLGVGSIFVGSHPMAGDHRSGWQASREGLFVDAPVYLCAPRDAALATVAAANAFWRDLGGRPLSLDAAAHDERLAWTSHLPHVIAAALALSLSRGGVRREELGPGGREMTRLAGSSPEMWTAIAMENAEALDAALASAEAELGRFRAALGRCDEAGVRAQWSAARAWFESE